MIMYTNYHNLKSVAARILCHNVYMVWCWTALSKDYFLYCDHRPLVTSVEQWCELMPQLMDVLQRYIEKDMQVTELKKKLVSLCLV
jgi:hypothetical protein